MKKRLTLLVTGLIFILTTGLAGANIINYHGYIDQHHTVDYFDFSLDTGGDLDITLAATYNSDFDTQMYLFSDDGSLDWGNLIAGNDDGGIGLNSLILGYLGSGDYTLAISSYLFRPYEAITGTNYNISGFGDYSLLLASSGTLSTANAPVPEPATLLLLGTGLLGLVGIGRKKFNKKA